LVLASCERSFEECDALPRDSSASFPTPSAFGRYRVVHQVGVGVLGPVFRGYDPEHDRVVAIKALFLDVTPEQAADVAADFDRLPSLSIPHAFIISPFAGGHEGSVAFLVQEYFVADSADVALKQYGPPPVPDALRLIGQLAGALDAAAAAGLHHGSLHLRDVLVAPNEMRLTGLGVVPAIERVGYRPQPRRPYAAPERMTGEPVTLASDVFSLACLSFELLTARRPVPSGDGVSVDTSGIQAADGSALSEVFARVLSARSGDRHPSALAFAAALKHALTGAPLQTGIENDPPKPRRARARKAPVLPFDEAPPPAESASVEHTPAAMVVAEPAEILCDEPAIVTVAEPIVAIAAEPVAGEPVAPEPVALAPEPTIAVAAEPVIEVESEPVAETAPMEVAESAESEARMFSDDTHEPRTEQAVAAPRRRSLAPLLGMLAIGLVVGFGLGYLVAPRGARVPAVVPAVAPAAATPSAAASGGPSAGAGALAAAAPAEKPPTPAKAAQGTLVVASKPAGALVFIDGHEAGRTPLTVRDVKPGSRKVRLELNGYRPWSLAVRVAAGRQRRVVASLERRPGG
jgi:serine/threonine-protein kinase